MAVKVRCPTCEKVLNAPDSARGKAVKCPGCETKVKVPAGDGGESAAPARTAKATAKKAEADSSEFLANLDINKAEDTSESMCPKCGASIPEDATECPACGVDPTTGQLSARARKRKGMKGPDPALFYSLAWTDSWAFTKANWTVALRTALYLTIFQLVIMGCSWMVDYCETAPPKIFWASMVLVSVLLMPGWVWYLTLETVRTTVARKTDLGRVNFDAFTNIALGIKWVLWIIAFCWFPPAAVMFPLVMVHMAMPVTKRGWMNFLMASTFFKNIGPTLYFWLIWFVGFLILAAAEGICYAVAYFADAKEIAEFIKTGNLVAKDITVARWILLVGIAVMVMIFFNGLSGFLYLFKMRVIGLLAYYFKDSLDLVVLVAEKTYQRKEVKVDKWGNPIKPTEKKVIEAVVALVVIAIVAGVGYWIYVTQFKKT